MEPLSEVGRWNRLIWAGVHDHVGQADYADSIQLAYLVSQKLHTNMRISQERSSAVLHDPLSSRHLKFEV